ncbi:MAG TPA: metallophosphoesterase family protein [Pyrinomonadaceae bacterium]|nr:metallophosphoesterase family protein [Pyrinomonadaceae bacterium]
MRTVIHLSDLHFGRVDERLLAPLVKIIHEMKPDLIAVSGDLTQRARSHQFIEARAFLDALPKPQIVVPGNHDIPLHNVFARFLSPLDKYRRYITDDLQPFYADEEMVVVGVSTARSLTFKGGRINQEQVGRVRERLCSYHDDMVKVLVTHHPFDLPEGYSDRDLVGRAQMAMAGLAECGADLFLAGHLHVMYSGHTAKRYNIKGHSALVVQAGTATSTRGRGEVNSFNVIRLNHPDISVERLGWNPDNLSFAVLSEEHFRHSSEGWTRI